MSIVPKETIEVITQSIGISNLSPDAALSLAPDVEHRMREIAAIKCMRHSRRTVLTVDDVDGALSLKNVEPVNGFAFGGPLQFKRAIGYKDLFYIDDKDLDLKDIIEAPLPKAPLDTSVHCHWLAIEGVHPTIPENTPVQVIANPVEGKKHDQKDDGLPIDIKLPIRHVLSRELQLYFEKITELTLRNPDSALFKEALRKTPKHSLVSLATDSGLHPLVPYFTCFIADEVSRGLSDIPLLFAVMRVVQSLFHNPHVNVEPYLHQLMPAVVTCLVAKKMGKRLSDNHWELRDFVASLVASICKRYAQTYITLQSRLTRQLVNAFLNPSRVLATQYGSIQGLAALGPNMVRLLILPNVEQYLKLLEAEMLLEVQKSKIKRFEAWRVYGALLRACGQCVYDRLKILASFPFPLPGPPLKSNAGVVTPSSRKHKLNGEHSEKQSPPSKRMAIDDPVISPPTDTIPANNNVPEEANASTAPCNSLEIPEKSGEAMASADATGEEKVKENGFVPSMCVSAIHRQIWKDELDSGYLLVSLFEMFGESILPFIPSPETSIFL